MAIKCCHGCIAPKRYPGCHDHCPTYAAEKAEDVAQKEAYQKKHALDTAITDQRTRAVMKAMKHRRKGKCCEQ